MNRKNTKITAAFALMVTAMTLIFSLPVCSFAEDNTDYAITEEVNLPSDATEEAPTNAEADNEAPTDPSGVGNSVPNDHVGGDNSQNNLQNDTSNSESDSSSGDNLPENEQNGSDGGDFEKNVFEEIYHSLELNADKIFSILAFIGTLLVGVGYKSGLLPLLRDTLTKLKGAIDGVKADGEENKAKNEEKFAELSTNLQSIGNQLRDMKWQYESYDEICRERESMKVILQGQIDMLYAIFMTSTLPQYQKDEIGERISQMREELKKYESSEEN